MDSNEQNMVEKHLNKRCKELYAETVQQRRVMKNLERLIYTQAQLEGANSIRRASEEAETAQLKDRTARLQARVEELEQRVEWQETLHKQQHTVLQEHYGERKRLERENTKLKKLLKQRNAKLRGTEEALTRRTAELVTRPAKKGN